MAKKKHSLNHNVLAPACDLRMVVAPGHYKLGKKERPSEIKKASSARNGRSPCKPGKRRGRKCVWTPEKIAEILRMVRVDGMAAADVARAKGIHPSMISRWRKAKL